MPAEPLELPDLIRFPVLAYARGSQPHHDILRLIAAADIPAKEARIYNTNSIATMIRLLCDGIGVTALPPAVVREALERGLVRRIGVQSRLQCVTFNNGDEAMPIRQLEGADQRRSLLNGRHGVSPRR